MFQSFSWLWADNMSDSRFTIILLLIRTSSHPILKSRITKNEIKSLNLCRVDGGGRRRGETSIFPCMCSLSLTISTCHQVQFDCMHLASGCGTVDREEVLNQVSSELLSTLTYKGTFISISTYI